MTPRKSAGMKKLETEIYLNPIQYLEKFISTYSFGQIVLPRLPKEYEDALREDLFELQKLGRHYVRRYGLEEALFFYEGEWDYRLEWRIQSIEDKLHAIAREQSEEDFFWLHENEGKCFYGDYAFWAHGESAFYAYHENKDEDEECTYFDEFELVEFDEWVGEKIAIIKMAEFQDYYYVSEDSQYNGYTSEIDDSTRRRSFPLYCAIPGADIDEIKKPENAGYIAFNSKTLTFIESEKEKNTAPTDRADLKISKLPPLQMSLKP